MFQFGIFRIGGRLYDDFVCGLNCGRFLDDVEIKNVECLYFEQKKLEKIFMSIIICAFQQMLAVLAATIAVPAIVGNGLTPASAMFGAGVGTLVYLAFTQFRSPVFLGSSFAFIGPMFAAFAGGVSMSLGMLGLIIGSFFAGLVYVVISLVVRFTGTGWVNRVMPPVIIGPTVSIIGLSLARNAISDLGRLDAAPNIEDPSWIAMLCGLVTLFVTMVCATFGNKKLRMMPFIVGILAGYAVASIFTFIGLSYDIQSLRVIDFSVFETYMMPRGELALRSFFGVPDFVFRHALGGISEVTLPYVITIFVAYVPVSFVVFAEHIADHKNLSSIIGTDLLEDPGLHRTLNGDGIGSMVGAFYGGCPNTTYGESIACVAITGNFSTHAIGIAAAGCIAFSFLTPFVAFIDSIPACVMGGVCIALYGFIAVSGLKMLQKVNLDENKNLFVASTIFIAGVGGLTVTVGAVTLTSIAAALILGILVNLVLREPK